MRGLCQKGEECEYLHKYVHERVPDCPNGVFCVNPDCPFSHGSKAECILYNQGFCPFGPNCLRVHVKKPKEQLPPIDEVLKKVRPTQDKSQQQQQQQSVVKPTVVYYILLYYNSHREVINIKHHYVITFYYMVFVFMEINVYMLMVKVS